MKLTEEIHQKLIKDLDHRKIKAWEVKRGTTPNPYPIARTYVWQLSIKKHVDKVGLGSVLILKAFIEQNPTPNR